MPESFEPQGFFNGEVYRFEDDGAILVCGAELSIANTDDHALAHREIGA